MLEKNELNIPCLNYLLPIEVHIHFMWSSSYLLFMHMRRDMTNCCGVLKFTAFIPSSSRLYVPLNQQSEKKKSELEGEEEIQEN